MANTALRVAELDFDTIKVNLKQYLRSQAEFTDYDFDGSGMSVLLDILAYNTHYMGYYLNMISNEMFLDTSQIRQSTISHAKLINYFPESAHGALAKVNITVTPGDAEDQVTDIITLDKYTNFLGADIDGVNHNFVTLYSNTASKTSGSFSFANVVLKQGEVVTRQYLMDFATNQYRRFNIPSANVDLDTLTITVQASSTDTGAEAYILADDITELTGNSKVFFVEEDVDQTYTFYFGDNYIGKKPNDGSIIIATYLDTDGSVANNISTFALADAIADEYTNNVSITTVTTSYSGTEKETIEQIKYRAPYFYTAQNRAVTKLDYETLITRDYNNIDAVSVWGGEENDPPVYGKVYMSLKTSGNYALTNLEKENIVNTLVRNRNVVTVTPEIVDPVYVYLLLSGQVTYNPSLTNRTSGEIDALIDAAVSDYSTNNLNRFDSVFRLSKLQSTIEASEPAITGSDIDIYAQRRIEITTGQTKTYEIDFDMPLRKGDFLNKLYTFPQVTVNDASGISRNIFFEEVPNSFTGVDSIEITNPGLNYTSAPTVTITGDGTGATATATVINGKLRTIEVTNKGIDYTRAIVSLTGGEGSQATARAVLEARNGTLRTYYFNTAGQKVILNSEAGTINYDTGRITLDALSVTAVVANDLYDTNILTINVIPENDIIRPLRNRIITIDETISTHNTIDVVAET